MYFVAVPALTFDPVHSFLEVAKIIYQMLIMLTLSIKALDFHFLYILVCFACYFMYAKIVKQMHI